MKASTIVCVCAGLLAVSSGAAFADTTYSGTALSGLLYLGDSGDAQYVTSPAAARLSTPDSGTTGDSPAVFVKGPLGKLSAFSASYTLLDFTGPSNSQPYWNIVVSPNGDSVDTVRIISMGGSPLDITSAVHAYNNDYSASVGSWGNTVGALCALTYNGHTIGDMTVNWAGVEIGDWDNGTQTIPASADIQSITVVPEPASLALLGLGGLLLMPRRRRSN